MGKGIVKLGEGNWAVKDGNLLAAKETNGRFKNTEFTVSRGTRASYVGRDGLIKESNLQDVNLVNNGDFSELGSELVTNGTFDTDSDWSTTSTWDIVNNQAEAIGNGISQYIQQDFSITNGNVYKFSYEIIENTLNGNGASLSSSGGFGSVSLSNVVGTHTEYITASNDAATYVLKIGVSGTATSGAIKIDNISVKEVDPNDYWTLTGGWSIADNKLSCDGTNDSLAYQSLSSLNLGDTLKVTYTITDYTSGILRIGTGAALQQPSGIARTSSGTYVEYITKTDGLSAFGFRSYSFNGSIDNISIQEIKTDTPRIDFTDNTDGHLLLEPQSTNLVTYSEDFSDSSWAKTNCTINSNNSISPEGTQNADKLDFTTSSGEIVRTTSFVSGQEYTMSFYAKTESGTLDFNYGNMDYTMNSGTATTEWQRFEITQTLPSTTRFPKIQTTEIGSLLLWGFQIEQLSHSTSYIATNGSTVTRDADTCTDAGSSADFNSEEGVLYAEIAALANDGTNRPISIGDGTTSNVVRFYYSVTDNRIVGNVKSGGSNVFNYNNVLSDATDFIKVAISYKADEYKMYVNGTQVSTDTSGAAPIGLTELAFDNGAGTDDFYGKCKAIRVYKEALSDTDLENLTS